MKACRKKADLHENTLLKRYFSGFMWGSLRFQR